MEEQIEWASWCDAYSAFLVRFNGEGSRRLDYRGFCIWYACMLSGNEGGYLLVLILPILNDVYC